MTNTNYGLEKKIYWNSKDNPDKSFLDSYFQPKEFEKSGRLYEHLGVRYVKKITLALGDLIQKITKGNIYKIPGEVNKTALKSREKLTKFAEVVHMPLGMSGIYFASMDAISGNYTRTLLHLGAALFNFSLVMLQRYNRAKIQRVQKKLEERTEKFYGRMSPADKWVLNPKR
jgi:hypothetical protein